jgi:hypothetical protein
MESVQRESDKWVRWFEEHEEVPWSVRGDDYDRVRAGLIDTIVGS